MISRADPSNECQFRPVFRHSYCYLGLRPMPPRWPRQPDRADPAYRRLDDRMNFALHVAIFLASNSGLWFFEILNHPWAHLNWFTLAWAIGLFGHGLYIFQIADYSEPEA